MARLKRIGHNVVYEGVEEVLAEKAAQALINLNLTCLSRQELVELFAERGELPIEATLIDAELLRENFARIGFDAKVVRDTGASVESPYVELKRNEAKIVSSAGITGIVSFGIAGLAQVGFRFLPIPFLSMLAFPAQSSATSFLALPLVIVEGYFIGILMTVFHYGALMGLLIGFAVGVLQVLCLAGGGSIALPMIGSLLIAADIKIKSGELGFLPTDGRAMAWRHLSKPLNYFVISHLIVAAICYSVSYL